MSKLNIISDLEQLKDIDCGECLKAVYFCNYEQESVDGDVKCLMPVIHYFEENNKKLELTVITVLGIGLLWQDVRRGTSGLFARHHPFLVRFSSV